MLCLCMFSLFTTEATSFIKPQNIGSEIQRGLERDPKAQPSLRSGYKLFLKSVNTQLIADLFLNSKKIEAIKKAENSAKKARFSDLFNRYLGGSFPRKIQSADLKTWNENLKYLSRNTRDAFLNFIAKAQIQLNSILGKIPAGYVHENYTEISVAGKLEAGMNVQLGVEFALLKLAIGKLARSGLNFASSKDFMRALKTILKNNLKILTGLSNMLMNWEPIVYKAIGNHRNPRMLHYQFKPNLFALDVNDEKDSLALIPKRSLVDLAVTKLSKAGIKLADEEFIGCPALKLFAQTPSGKKNLVEIFHNWFVKQVTEELFPWIEKNIARPYCVETA